MQRYNYFTPRCAVVLAGERTFIIVELWETFGATATTGAFQTGVHVKFIQSNLFLI